jgi:putative Mg2+ transporter-C (MgtC) family protein
MIQIVEGLLSLDWSIAGRLALSALLSGVIGIERSIRGKPAGLRTHLLVSLGSSLIMLISIKMGDLYPGKGVDPTRIAANVVAGLGFLGAGTIIHSRGSIQGLTTAASLWATGAIGLAVGCEYYQAAIQATIAILLALHMLDRLERFVVDRLAPGVTRAGPRIRERIRKKLFDE